MKKRRSLIRLILERILAPSVPMDEDSRRQIAEVINGLEKRTIDLTHSFQRVRDIMYAHRQPLGWNKFWAGNDLKGWHGELITALPLRAAALEIGDDPNYELIRKRLEGMIGWCHGGGSIDDASSPAINCASTGENSDTSIPRILKELGFCPPSEGVDKDAARLLRRLNIDRRELPFIGRVNWSDKAALLELSDEGRMHITLECALMRSIESGLDDYGRLGEELKDFLIGISRGDCDLHVNSEDAAGGLAACMRRLEFYGITHRVSGSVKIHSAMGEFAAYALQLWGND